VDRFAGKNAITPRTNPLHQCGLLGRAQPNITRTVDDSNSGAPVFRRRPILFPRHRIEVLRAFPEKIRHGPPKLR